MAGQSRRAIRCRMEAMGDPCRDPSWRSTALDVGPVPPLRLTAMPKPQVVVVGAGPAGAALSYLLARRGIGVTLLERHTDFAREFRGEGLMPSGVAALTDMGLESALATVPQAPIAAVEFFRGPRAWFRVTPEQLGGAGPRIVSQPGMLEMLVAEAARFPSFRR